METPGAAGRAARVRFAVEAGGRERAVEITGRDGRYRAVVDGRVWIVDGVRAGGAWSLLLRDDEAGDEGAGDKTASAVSRSRQVTLAPAASGEMAVSVDGHPVSVRVTSWASGRRRDRSTAGAATGPQQVAAPMPGRIVKVLVKAGDVVTAGQPLVVVEAMKMENELRAARAGTVSEVRVVEGAPVEAGALLMVIA